MRLFRILEVGLKMLDKLSGMVGSDNRSRSYDPR